MEEENCAICGQGGDVICFCSNTVLCCKCVGKHLMSSPKQVHKTVVLKDTALRALLSSSWRQIKEKESEILLEAAEMLQVETAAKKRIKAEIEAVDSFCQESLTKLQRFSADLKSEIDQLASSLRLKITSACEQLKSSLSTDASLLSYLKSQPLNSIDKSTLTTSLFSIPQLQLSKLISDSLIFELTADYLKSPNPFSLDLSPSQESPPYKRCRTRVSTKLTKKSLPTNIYSCVPGKLVLFNIQSNITETCELEVDSHSVCTLVPDGSIVITGGVNSKATFIYQIFEKCAERVEDSAEVRMNHSAVTLGDFLYVIGGRSVENVMKSCERYDLVHRKWQKVADLVNAREMHSACVYRGRIFVAGGNGIDTLEVYNTVSNKFSTLRTQLSSPGNSLMFSFEDFVIIFHDKSVSTFDPANFTCQLFTNLEESDWYTNSTSLIMNKQAYFIKESSVYKYEVEHGVISVCNKHI